MVNAIGAEMIWIVITDEPIGETMELIWSVKVHPADLNGFISSSTKGVGESRDTGVEILRVGPDFGLVGMLSGEHRCSGWDADWRCAVTVFEDDTTGCQSVEVRCTDYRIAVCADHRRVVLVGFDEENVRTVVGHI